MSEVQDIIDEFNMWIERGAKPRITTEETKRLINEVEKLQKILLNLSEYHGSAEKTIEKLNSDVEKWRNTALQLSNNHGQAQNKVDQLEADYIISNRELLVLQVELARRDEELKITDGLLKEATETIGAVVACCTYSSNEDAKIGVYGIDQKAFTMIDQFITHYNDAVSAGKVSVDDVKRELSDAEINELGAREAEKRDKHNWRRW